VNIRQHAGRAGVITLALAATSVTALLVSPAAGAATPPWQSPSSNQFDPNRVGTLTFYNASGTQIFGGNIHAAPTAAYIVGSHALRTGDTEATLLGFLSQSTAAGGWSGEQLTAASAYPNAAAPSSISRTLPVYSGAANDTTLADLIATYPSTSTNPSYANVYELRLRTSHPDKPAVAFYDVADIKVTGNTWQLIYPSNILTTATTLTASPTSGAKAGAPVTLTATVAPAAPGTVRFSDGATALGAPVSVSGGHATKTVTLATARMHALTATFTPADTTKYSASTGTKPYAVGKSASTTKATWPSGKRVYGKAFTVKATVKSAGLVPTGKVTLKFGGKTLATKKLAKGKASLRVAGTALKPGSHKLVLSYGGSANTRGSSLSKKVSVVKAKSKTTNALRPKSVSTSKRATLTVHVTAGGVHPAGIVKVYDGSKLIAKVTLKAKNKGKAVVSLPTLTAGKHKIHAGYAGSALVTASAASKVTLTVTAS
jgi:Bacterial Ig-like domain (group 3)